MIIELQKVGLLVMESKRCPKHYRLSLFPLVVSQSKGKFLLLRAPFILHTGLRRPELDLTWEPPPWTLAFAVTWKGHMQVSNSHLPVIHLWTKWQSACHYIPESAIVGLIFFGSNQHSLFEYEAHSTWGKSCTGNLTNYPRILGRNFIPELLPNQHNF